MRPTHFVFLFALTASTLLSAAGYPGKADVDNGPGETFLQAGQCYLRVKGAFRCPKKELRDDDILVVVSPPTGTLTFGGLEDEDELDATCNCDNHDNSHSGKWICSCPTPGSGNGTFNYSVSCVSKKTGQVTTVLSSPKVFSIKCP